MYWTKKHLLVCTASHCAQKGANEVVGKLRLDVLRRGLDSEILVNNCGTIDLCDIGPNIVIYPDNIILSGVTVRDIPEIIAFLKEEGDISNLVTSPAAPPEIKRHAFYGEVVAMGTTIAADKFAALAEFHEFDKAWIDEQARRGFIARKPGESEGEQVITVTKKAIDRYGLRA
jgi:(2Fe-2S) ferredoxin